MGSFTFCHTHTISNPRSAGVCLNKLFPLKFKYVNSGHPVCSKSIRLGTASGPIDQYIYYPSIIVQFEGHLYDRQKGDKPKAVDDRLMRSNN